MANIEQEVETTPAQEHYDQAVKRSKSERFEHLVRRLEDSGVKIPNLTGDIYDIVVHGQLVGSIIMDAFREDPNSHINPGALRMKIGEIVTLREVDKPQYIVSKQLWQENVRRYQDTHPEIIATQSLKEEAAGHPLQPLLSHVLLSMGALLDSSQDTTATVGRGMQPQQKESA